MSGEAIYIALTSGVMKTRAEGLSTAQIFALIGYIAPTGGTHAAGPNFTPTCKGNAAFQANRELARNGTAGAPAQRTRDFRTRPRRGSPHLMLGNSS